MKHLSYNPWIVGKAHIQFWRANLETARLMMQTLPPEQVDLRDWRDPERREQVDGVQYAHDAPTNATIAGFGGWCAWNPTFRQLGVTAGQTGGQPLLNDLNLVGSQVAMYLFGSHTMFDARVRGELGTMTDHEVVLDRIAARVLALIRADRNRAQSSSPGHSSYGFGDADPSSMTQGLESPPTTG